MIPIAKVTNAASPSDFRPISLLPVLGKMLEKLMSTPTLKRTIYSIHIGMVCDFTNDIYRAVHENSIITLVFIEFRKALGDRS